jgi:CBS domain-containing protein
VIIMRVGDLCSPAAKVAGADQALAEAARTMLAGRVGSLVVVDGSGKGGKPIGMLTDRDIVRGQLRLSADLFCLTVGDVMTAEPLTLTADTSVTEAIEAMHARAVRRAPVVDGSGSLLGIVTLDDLLPAVARELEELATLIGTQTRHERALVG